MDHPYTGGSWTMIPNVPSHSSSPATHSNQDQFYLHPQSQLQSQQFNQFQQQQQQQNQQQQFQQQQRLIQQQQQQQQNQHHQSLASHFHLLHLVENLAEVIDNGSRDQHSDALITELNNQFEKCQQLLNSISSSINTKAMTVEGQKRKLEDSEQLLNQRRDLISKYRNSVEELLKSDP
ncbi:mediator of RNA polymerase II transcription subunit 9 isoform X1 [Ricinus communis]|uniref:mediator of RNA polymerase II transcription subunit 9 isoform X1 n=1 Tax=Ricinus communis TaxID=3988 RepID=UPI00077272AF|nr:mediator of RNA polymerase II transcription subunit 9 isoform X1 [Ricinus communis]XP_015580229.1 mediator of RNA polymerase II transcription subunit 9 isoform X1 [Ricinus communis]|eukprot:XP_002528128.2 mediator of RNA polymerase II transcription subunit 9 isoform X1 [Ricinus communis]